MKIALTIRSFNSPHLLRGHDFKINETGRHLKGQELIDFIGDSEGVLAGTEKFTKEVLTQLPSLRVISRVGTGVDNIDMNIAEELGIKICRTPVEPADAVCEHVFALVFALLKNLKCHIKNMENDKFEAMPGNNLKGKVFGICGLGIVGKKVAQMAEKLGCSILYYDPYTCSSYYTAVSDLGYLFELSDIVSIHVSSSVQNKNLINRKILREAKKGLILINTSRGNVIEESAVFDFASSGLIRGVGLDVYEVEPYCGPLCRLDNVITTPHVASNTYETRLLMEGSAVSNLLVAGG